MTARWVGCTPGMRIRASSFHSMLQKPYDGADRQAVGLARQRRQGVIGAEDVARAVDQEDMVARLEGGGLGGCGFRRGVGFRLRHGRTMPRGCGDGYGGAAIAETAKLRGGSPRCQVSHMVT